VINNKLQGSVGKSVTGLFIITKLRKVYCRDCQWKKLKLVNIWQSYKEQRGCLTLCAPGQHTAQTQSASHSCLQLCQIFTDLKKIIDRLSNKAFLIWLTTPPHLKYVAILLCNLSLITCFLTLMFHKVVWLWQHVQGVVGFSTTALLQI